MRITKSGSQYQQDLSAQAHAAALGIRQGWRGDRASTLSYYRRIVAVALADLEFRRPDYARHCDMAKYSAAVSALDALAESLAEGDA